MKNIEFEQFRELMKADRTIRVFNEAAAVSQDTLLKLVELTRYCASGRNAQPIKYRLVTEKEERDAIYPYLAWAGYYKDWDGPEEGQRPAAYLIQWIDTDIATNCLCDDGLHLQAITLGAKILGLSGCIIKSFKAGEIAKTLRIDERYKLNYVLALGVAAEDAKVVRLPENGDFKYFRDEKGTQCVPKRELKDLII